MTQAEMEDALEKLNVRMSSVEQVLPTLATKIDLERFATKADLERFATKQDLERTNEALREGLADSKRHTEVLVESVRDDIRLVAEGVASLITKVDSLSGRVDGFGHRLHDFGNRLDSANDGQP